MDTINHVVVDNTENTTAEGVVTVVATTVEVMTVDVTMAEVVTVVVINMEGMIVDTTIIKAMDVAAVKNMVNALDVVSLRVKR
jgi:hypothetical protein